MRHSTSPDANTRRVRVYKYGLLPPRTPHEDIALEDRKLVDLWNALVEMGEKSRAEWEQSLMADPALASAARSLAELKGALEQARDRKKKLGRDASEESRVAASREIRLAKEEFRTQLLAFRLVKNEVRKGLRERRDELIALRESRIVELRREAKAQRVHWASADAVVDQWRTSWALALKGTAGFPRPKHPVDSPPPHVFRYTQGGCPLSRLFSPRSRLLRLSVAPAAAPPDGQSRSAGRRWARLMARGQAHIQIGSRAYDFGLILHRRPPAMARVKRAIVSRSVRLPGRSLGRTWDWHLLLTVEEPGEASPHHPHPGTLAALSRGWRRVDGRLRVGVLVSRDGQSETLSLPEKVLARDEESRRLQIRLDFEVEELKAKLQPLLARTAAQDEAIRPFLSSWERLRSGGLLRLLDHLVEAGSGDEAVLALNLWNHRRQRLLKIRRRVLGHLQRHRAWWWQNTMLGLCRNFATVVVLDLSLERLMRQEAGAHPVQDRIDARTTANQQLAGHHEGFRWLGRMAAKTGTVILTLDNGFISAKCSGCARCTRCGSSLEPASTLAHRCGAPKEDWSEADAQMRCSACGLTLDNGENTARNLLALAGCSAHSP